MMRWRLLSSTIVLLLSALLSALALQAHAQALACKSTRREWFSLSGGQQSNFISAFKSLSKATSKCGSSTPCAPENMNLADLANAHVALVAQVHGTALFWVYHRAMINAFERAMSVHGYEDSLPYWDWTAANVCDSDFHTCTSSDLDKTVSAVIDSVGGYGDSWTYCVDPGSIFGDYKVNVRNLPSDYVLDGTRPRCLVRDPRNEQSDYPICDASEVRQILQHGTYKAAWTDDGAGSCHSNGHNYVGGEMADMAFSPVDVLFYLHHAMIDKLYWMWQTTCASSRQWDTGVVKWNQKVPFFQMQVGDLLDTQANCYDNPMSVDVGCQSDVQCVDRSGVPCQSPPSGGGTSGGGSQGGGGGGGASGGGSGGGGGGATGGSGGTGAGAGGPPGGGSGNGGATGGSGGTAGGGGAQGGTGGTGGSNGGNPPGGSGGTLPAGNGGDGATTGGGGANNSGSQGGANGGGNGTPPPPPNGGSGGIDKPAVDPTPNTATIDGANSRQQQVTSTEPPAVESMATTTTAAAASTQSASSIVSAESYWLRDLVALINQKPANRSVIRRSDADLPIGFYDTRAEPITVPYITVGNVTHKVKNYKNMKILYRDSHVVKFVQREYVLDSDHATQNMMPIIDVYHDEDETPVEPYYQCSFLKDPSAYANPTLTYKMPQTEENVRKAHRSLKKVRRHEQLSRYRVDLINRRPELLREALPNDYPKHPDECKDA